MSNCIIVCGCERSKKFTPEQVNEITAKLDAQQTPYTYVNDLCGLVITQSEQLREHYNDKAITLFGCKPRAVQSLMDKAGFRDTSITCYDLQDTQINLTDLSAATGPQSLEYTQKWEPWF